MHAKSEGAVFRPVPVVEERRPEAAVARRRAAQPNTELRCEMCFAPVLASHCKRICLRCGFMTGCSEGI
jgi:hypothetical protein